MTAQFEVYKSPNPKKEDSTVWYHARLVSSGTIRINDLVREINENTSFSPADVRGLLQAFFDTLTYHLRAGESVELEGLGYFSVSVESPQVEDPKEIRTGNVHFKAVNYRCSVALKEKLKTMRIGHSPKEETPVYSAEKRQEHILNYLRKKGIVGSSECMDLNGCTRYQALQDLKSLINEQKITRIGRRKASYYTLVQ